MDIEKIERAMDRAIGANWLDPLRHGNLIELPGRGEVMFTGDLHGSMENFSLILKVADLAHHPKRHLIIHEAVHQLFQESRSAARRLGRSHNFWILEGIATYFETLTEHGGPEVGRYYTVGQTSAGRLPSARRRLMDDGFYLPLGRFVRLGKSDLQRHADIAKLYSQGAVLAAFLMQGEDGRYREPLVHYLTAF